MSIAPDALGEFEPRQLLDMIEGYVWRQRQEMEMTAWQTLHIINAVRSIAMTKRPPKPLQMRDLIPWFGLDDEDA